MVRVVRALVVAFAVKAIVSAGTDVVGIESCQNELDPTEEATLLQMKFRNPHAHASLSQSGDDGIFKRRRRGNSIVNSVSNAVSDAADTAAAAVDAATSVSSPITVGGVVDAVADAVEDAVDTTGDVVDAVTGAVVDSAGNAIDTTVDVGGFVVGTAGEVAGGAVNVADSLASAAAETTADGVDFVVGTATTIIDTATGIANSVAAWLIDDVVIQLICTNPADAAVPLPALLATTVRTTRSSPSTCGGEEVEANDFSDCVVKGFQHRQPYISYRPPHGGGYGKCNMTDTCDAEPLPSPCPENDGDCEQQTNCFIQYSLGSLYSIASGVTDSAIDIVSDVADSAIDTVSDAVDTVVDATGTVFDIASNVWTASVSAAVEALIHAFGELDTAQTYAAGAISRLQSIELRDLEFPDFSGEVPDEVKDTVRGAEVLVEDARDTAARAADAIMAITGTLVAAAAEAGDELADAATLAVSESVQAAVEFGVNAAQNSERAIQDALDSIDALIEEGYEDLSGVRDEVALVLDDVQHIVAGVIEATWPLSPTCTAVAAGAAVVGGSAGLVIGVTAGAAGGAVLGGAVGGVTGVAVGYGVGSVPLGLAIGGTGFVVGGVAGGVVGGASLAVVTGGVSGLAAAVICTIVVDDGLSLYVGDVCVHSEGMIGEGLVR